MSTLDKPLSEVFDACADSVTRTWAQNIDRHWVNIGPGIGHCAFNTIAELAAANNVNSFTAAAVLARALGGGDITDIFAWNDAPERTQAEVVAMFRALAATERARETEHEPEHACA